MTPMSNISTSIPVQFSKFRQKPAASAENKPSGKLMQKGKASVQKTKNFVKNDKTHIAAGAAAGAAAGIPLPLIGPIGGAFMGAAAVGGWKLLQEMKDYMESR